jgi:hypothetical protein
MWYLEKGRPRRRANARHTPFAQGASDSPTRAPRCARGCAMTRGTGVTARRAVGGNAAGSFPHWGSARGFAVLALALACPSARMTAQAPALGSGTQPTTPPAVGLAGSSSRPAVNAAAWFAYDGDHPLGRRLKFFFDASLRRAGEPAGVGAWQQMEALAGLSLAATSRWTVAAGAGAVRTYAYGERPMAGAEPERRLWSQVQWSGSAVGSTLALRTRVEHRWIAHSERVATGAQPFPDRWQYTARIVPEARVLVPVGRGPWYVTGAAEVFGRVFPREPYVEQMRESTAIGYRIGHATRVEVGYLHQTLRSPTQSDERNHAVLLILRSAARWRR